MTTSKDEPARRDDPHGLKDPRGGWLVIPRHLQPLVNDIDDAAAGGDLDRMHRSLQRLIKSTAADEDSRWLWAVSQQELGDLLARMNSDESGQHQEGMIAAYQAALSVYSPNICPDEWATVQNNLGNAFRVRQRGDRRENDQLAVSALEAALTVRTRQSDPYHWARTQNNIANIYAEWEHGDRAGYQRKAIEAYQLALDVHRIDEFPQDYAMDQVNLGLTYQDYSAGNRIANLDRAMECFLSALLVQRDMRRRRRIALSLADACNARMDLTPENHRGEVAASLRLVIDALAEAQIESAMAFGMEPESLLRAPVAKAPTNEDDLSWRPDPSLFRAYLLDGYRIIPLEELMRRLSSLDFAADPAFRVDTLRVALARDDVLLPSLRAGLLDELALALLRITTGDVAKNQEEAVAALRTASAAYSQHDSSYEWGTIQAHLALAYGNRLSGDRAENLERAIGHCRAAIDAFPSGTMDWALQTSNLGQYYRDRRLGDHRENARLAIAAFQAASRVLTWAQHPYEWARVQNSMGLTYRNQDNRNQEALEAFRAALKVLTRAEYPYEWAGAQSNFARVMLDRREGDRSDNIERAIEGFTASLLIHTRDNFPVDWAHAQHNLGQAYRHRIRGGRAENLQRAADCFSAALTVLTLADRTADYRATIGALGEVESDRGDWLAAHEAFAAASKASDQLLSEIRTGAHGFDDVVQGGHEVGELDAFALVQLGRLDEAVEAVERGRTRWVAESLEGAPADSPSGEVAVEAGQAIVYLMSTNWGGLALGVFGSPLNQATRVECCALPALTDDVVNDLVQVTVDGRDDRIVGGYGAAQEGRALSWLVGQWTGDTFAEKAANMHTACRRAGTSSSLDEAAAMMGNLRHPGLPEIMNTPLHALDDFAMARLVATLDHAFLRAELRRCLPKLAEIAMQTLTEWLLGRGVTSVTLIPCGLLPAFPLVCAPLDDAAAGPHGTSQWTTVADRLQANVVPSARILAVRPSGRARSGLYAVGDPRPTDQELRWAEAEALTAATLAGDPARARVHEAATRAWLVDGLQSGQVVDASCHGQFDGQDFLRSRLLLANQETLTLADVIGNEVDIAGLRLLVLSACQTAVMDIRGARGEVRSLAAGMLQAGVRSVMAPLWAVDDRATYLLIVRFMQEWLPAMDWASPAGALSRAQYWLRSVTNRELVAWAVPEVGSSEATLVSVRGRGDRYSMSEAEQLVTGLARRADPGDLDETPYADPIFWAGFQVLGP